MGGVSLGAPVTSGRERTGKQWWGLRRSCWEVGESQDGMGPQRPVKKRSEEAMADCADAAGRSSNRSAQNGPLGLAVWRQLVSLAGVRDIKLISDQQLHTYNSDKCHDGKA